MRYSYRYKLEIPLTNFLRGDDKVFSSNRGIFINRGYVSALKVADLKNTLQSLNADNAFEQSPFIVFALPFTQSTSTSISLPEEIIHIDSSGWVTHFSNNPIDTPVLNAAPERPHHIELSSPESRDQFIEKVRLAIKHIEVGEVEKIVLARQLLVTADIDIDPRLLINELIDSQPDSYIYSVDSFVGASPELLVEKFSKSVHLRPMAGTRKRHARIGDDDATIADLQTNKKDLAEHKVVTQDILKKLSTVSNDVSASPTPHVVRLPHVSHLTTDISATLNSNTDLLSLVDLLHPTPAVAGTPTKRAVELISDIEGFERGTYGAPVGYIDSNGDGQCAIALRCAKVKSSQAQLYAGVGIVKDSNPDLEFEETQAKFSVMRDALLNLAQ